MSAKVSFLSREVTPDDQKPLKALPADAVVQRDGRPVVFVVRDNAAVAVPVSAGVKLGDLVAVTGELRSGEKVVVKPSAELASGAQVRIAAK
jgi:hypothetical protein